MILKKVARILSLLFLTILVLVIFFLIISIGPLDRTPVQETAAYKQMMNGLDTMSKPVLVKANDSFFVGYSKVNLTPSFRTATAGYGTRRGKQFTSVHDSIFVRTLVIANGNTRVAIVSADLLIIPPTVTRSLKEKLEAIGFSLDNTYLGATHSHNSMGNWGEGATRFIYGPYEDSVVDLIVEAIVQSISDASANLLPSVIKSGAIRVPELVKNRVIDDGPEDPFLRVLEVHRSDSTRLVLTSFTAHATCLYSRDLELSRDYPGKLVDTLETKGYNFAMFIAGAVGSHACSVPKFGWDCVDVMGTSLAAHLLEHRGDFKPVHGATVWMTRIPLALPEPQVKIAQDWKIRSWLFRSAFGEYPADLSMLRLGNILMIGTPCDFSGEFDASLDSLAQSRQARLIITSFNGGYIGYVTPKKYYDVDHYETQLMNWYPPGTGEYISACVEKIISRAMEE
jgi:neutral ceramidase